ncbi:hypothetical protein BHM03_00062999 [Ensete ventricosum]|nr:hypothetical protein BHM03_00062999 [Ensete ventricosum]
MIVLLKSVRISTSLSDTEPRDKRGVPLTGKLFSDSDGGNNTPHPLLTKTKQKRKIILYSKNDNIGKL